PPHISRCLLAGAATRAPRGRHPFPTRRSSDLQQADTRIRHCTGQNRRFVLLPGGLMLTVDVIKQIEQYQEQKKPAHPNLIMDRLDRKSTRLNSSHVKISYAVFCSKKKRNQRRY